MSSKAIAFVITVLFASLASGQAPEGQERVFIASTAGAQDLEQMDALFRAIADIRQVSTDAVQKSIAVHGTAQQIALAQWLFNQLERPAGAQPSTAAREYRLPGEYEGVVRMFYMTQAKTVPELQEGAILLRMMTGIGSMTGIRRMYTYNAAQAVAARGTADQIATAQWLYEALNRPAGAQAAPEHQVAGSSDELLRLFHLTHAETVQDFQEVNTLIRSLTDIRWVCTYSAGKAVSVRGTASQVALAAWLFNELERLAGSQSSAAAREYRMSDENEGTVKVFCVTQARTVQELYDAAILLRSKTGIRRVYSYYPVRAVAVRGTADQVAAAERLISEQTSR